jgi:hypothetical protein
LQHDMSWLWAPLSGLAAFHKLVPLI